MANTPLSTENRRPSFFSRHKILLLVTSLIFIFIVIPMFFFFSLMVFLLNSGGEEMDKMVLSGSGEDKIAVLNIDGVIVEREPIKGLGSFSEDVTSARRIKRTLRQIENDENVKALILRIDSPGGSAAAAEEIYRELSDYKKRTGQKVVAYFSDMAASGGFYVAMPADQIVANPSTITGSIGVIISYINLQDLAEKYGVKSIVYKSGPYKDLISEFRMPSEEEKQIMQGVVGDVFENFIRAVAQGRGLTEHQVRTIADGRVFSAKQAQEQKLVDYVGTFEDAVLVSKKISGLDKASVVEYGMPGFWDFLVGSVSQKFNMSLIPGLENFYNLQNGAKVMYLYSPAM